MFVWNTILMLSSLEQDYIRSEKEYLENKNIRSEKDYNILEPGVPEYRGNVLDDRENVPV